MNWGLTKSARPNPLQAALASAAAFTVGGALPFLVTLFFPLDTVEYYIYGITTISLILLGAISAKTGVSSITKAVIRITFWGTAAMGLTALVGYLFNVSIG